MYGPKLMILSVADNIGERQDRRWEGRSPVLRGTTSPGPAGSLADHHLKEGA